MVKRFCLLILLGLSSVANGDILKSNGSQNNYNYFKPNCCKDCALGGNVEAQKCFIAAGKTPLGEDRAFSAPGSSNKTLRATDSP